MGLNDDAWKKLFEKYNILDKVKRNGYFDISANQIKEYREPRLMTKFDHSVNLPQIFADNNLAILPVSRGDYVISSFAAYQKFEETDTNVKRVPMPPHIQSLSPGFIISEAVALHCANACGVLKDFLEDDEVIPTVSGRMGSGCFNFSINTSCGVKSIDVNNSQIEIDAGYEGVNCLALFEAKMDLSEDFLVRQLYYPFRAWNSRVTKEVKPVFMVFSNGVFYLYQYRFDDPLNYNSLRLVKYCSYVIETAIHIDDILDIANTVKTVPEPHIPFPQANSMPRIINLMELLNKRSMTKADITTEYAFDERQTNYYTDAGRYLELIDKGNDKKGNIQFTLSHLGARIMGMPYRERQLAIVAAILKHDVFKRILLLHLQHGVMPDTNEIVQIMKASNLYNIGMDSTFIRRSSTITGWINWILGVVDE